MSLASEFLSLEPVSHPVKGILVNPPNTGQDESSYLAHRGFSDQ